MVVTKFKRDFLRECDGDWSVNTVGRIVCPCGQSIPDDGECTEGHVSPLRQAGLV